MSTRPQSTPSVDITAPAPPTGWLVPMSRSFNGPPGCAASTDTVTRLGVAVPSASPWVGGKAIAVDARAPTAPTAALRQARRRTLIELHVAGNAPCGQS